MTAFLPPCCSVIWLDLFHLSFQIPLPLPHPALAPEANLADYTDRKKGRSGLWLLVSMANEKLQQIRRKSGRCLLCWLPSCKVSEASSERGFCQETAPSGTPLPTGFLWPQAPTARTTWRCSRGSLRPGAISTLYVHGLL